MQETLLQKAQRLGIKPSNTPTTNLNTNININSGTESLLQKAQRLGIKPANEQGDVIGTIKDAFQSGIGQIKEGFNQGQTTSNPLGMLEAGTKVAAGAINAAYSPLAPVFKPFGDALNYVADKISDIPNVQKFAQSRLGIYTERIVNDIANINTIASAVAVPPTTKASISNVVKGSGISEPKIITQPKIPTNPYATKVSTELSKLDSKHSTLRKFNSFQKDGGSSIRQRIADSNILSEAGAVDENGIIRTKQPGGAVELYEDATLGSADQVVRKLLEKEGSKSNIDEIQIRLDNAIKSNFAPGEDLQIALNKAKREVASYRKSADADGNLPNILLQDRKIQTKANYLTPPEIQAYQKTLKSVLQKTIEKNSNYPVNEINANLAPYLKDLEYLNLLDGKRVDGGKLGKYFAQISGNIIGGAAGAAVGGIPGSAIGTVLGGELSSRLKTGQMQGTFGRNTGLYAKQSPVIIKAVQETKSPRLELKAPTEGSPRSSIGSGQQINLPRRTQSTIDSAYSNNLGNLNQQYKPTAITNSIPINQSKINPSSNTAPIAKTSSRIMDNSIPQKKGVVKTLVDKPKYNTQDIVNAYGKEYLGFNLRDMAIKAEKQGYDLWDNLLNKVDNTDILSERIKGMQSILNDLAPSKGIIKTLVDKWKDLPKQGGKISWNFSKKVNLHPDDWGVMRDFTDYVGGGYKPTGTDAYELELAASRISEKLGLPNFKTNKGLSHAFGKILEANKK